MLRPVTPEAPKNLKMNPPTTAPMIPKMMSRTIPSPDLFTILLPTNPAIKPRTIQARIDMCSSSSASLVSSHHESPEPLPPVCSQIGGDWRTLENDSSYCQVPGYLLSLLISILD